MNPGELRDRIRIATETATNVEGSVEYATTASRDVYADVRPGAAAQTMEAGASAQTAAFTVIIRADIPVSYGDTIWWGARKLNVESVVDPDNRGRVQELSCREID
jgi:SPP1 family predicted phage head-tail adaptor